MTKKEEEKSMIEYQVDKIDHAYEENRCRNILAAIENLMTQMQGGDEHLSLYGELQNAYYYFNDKRLQHQVFDKFE
jgi:hypothetical protein